MSAQDTNREDQGPKKGRPAKPPCPWSQDGTSALLAHLQRLTDAIEALATRLLVIEAKLDPGAPTVVRADQQAARTVVTSSDNVRTTDPRPEPNQWAPRP